MGSATGSRFFMIYFHTQYYHSGSERTTSMKRLAIALLPIIMLIGCTNDTTNEEQKTPHKDNSEVIMSEDQKDNVNAGEDTTSGTEKTEGSEETTTAPPALGKRDYLKKLNEVEAELAPLWKKSNNGTQTEMNEAATELFNRWDQTMNEVYDMLNSQLSEAEMNTVQAEQQAWLTKRDTIADKAAAGNKGGTLEPYVRAIKMAELTKGRSYELVKKYLK